MLEANAWFISLILKLIIVLLVLMLIWLAKIIVGKDAIKVFSSLVSEIKDLLAFKLTVGSLNFFGGIVIFFVGLLIILGKTFGFLISAITQYVGLQQAEVISNSNDVVIVFVSLAIYMIISILAVVANEKSKRLNRKS